MGSLRRASVLVPLFGALFCALAGSAHARESRKVLLVPPLEGADVITVAVERDGTRRLISRGLRVLVTTRGELAVGEEPLATDKAPVTVELPPRFGGGYLFAASTSGRTALWKARSWAGKLEPFADIDFEVMRIVPGFDRLHLQARRSGEWAALDPETGAGLDRGSLPPAPSFGAMAFVDSWFSAVELPVRGTVVSFDAGASWHPLGVETAALSVESGSLVVGGERSSQWLGADGRFRPALAARVEKRGLAGAERVLREGALGRLPLRTAVLRGVPDGDEAALVLSRGVLGRVRLTDGRVLAQSSRAVPASRECSGVRVGQGYGFVCGETRGKTEIYRVRAPLAVELVRRFETPRVVSASDNGALVVSGGCDPNALAARATDRRCIVTVQGSAFELGLSNSGLERVAALRDGRAAVLEPPSAERPGSLRLVDAAGQTKTLPLSLEASAEGGGGRALLKNGFWLQNLVESAPGVLSGWVVVRGSFLGVRVGLDGKIRTGTVQRSIENALLSGQNALVLGVSGLAEQTSDGGFSWEDADMPSSVESDAERADATAAEVEQGCSLIGCAFRRWLRVGWRSDDGTQPLRTAPRTQPTVLPSPGGGRWRLSCALDGRVSPPALPIVARRGYGTAEQVPSPWLPLLEVAAPALGAERAGIDVGTESELVQLRAYLWGPKADFGKGAAFQVRVADRYRVKNAVWSTAASASPWPDLEQALDAFGYEGNGPAGWRLALDPAGDAGVLSVNWRGTTDLFLLEHDRATRRIANAPRYGLGAVTSTVRIGATYYVVTQVDTRTFRVFALEPSAPRLVGEYRDVPFGGAGTPVLVRSTRDSAGQSSRQGALGLWARGPGWFVFPIDERTGVSAPALEVTPRTLAGLPRLCAEDEEGFLLEATIGLEPLIEWSGGEGAASVGSRPVRGAIAPFQARAVEGRFVVSAEGICVRELAAQADRPVRARTSARLAGVGSGAPRRSSDGGRGSVPLVLSDRGEGGRRYGVSCSVADD